MAFASVIVVVPQGIDGGNAPLIGLKDQRWVARFNRAVGSASLSRTLSETDCSFLVRRPALGRPGGPGGRVRRRWWPGGRPRRTPWRRQGGRRPARAGGRGRRASGDARRSRHVAGPSR